MKQIAAPILPLRPWHQNQSPPHYHPPQEVGGFKIIFYGNFFLFYANKKGGRLAVPGMVGGHLDVPFPYRVRLATPLFPSGVPKFPRCPLHFVHFLGMAGGRPIPIPPSPGRPRTRNAGF